MEYTIKNEYLTATIDSLGAECRKLVDKNNRDRLHDGSKESWTGVSPILFPQISRTPGFLYKVKGKEYTMPAHGFVRKREIPVYEQKEDRITFLLVDDAETWSMYPYHFRFYITYTLLQAKLEVSFKVVNLGEDPMLYMLGGHPAIKVPLYENETYEDYYIKFPYKETVDAMQVVNNYLANEYKPCLTNEDTIALKHSLFIPDAIVMRGLKSKYVDLLSKKSDSHVRFYFDGFEILAIWSMQQENANFVCFEPWNGIQKNFVMDHEKMGVLTLAPHDTYHVSYTIEIVV